MKKWTQKASAIIATILLITIASHPLSNCQEPTSGFLMFPRPLSAQSAGDPYLIGHVAVGLVFPESIGGSEHWTMDEIMHAYNEIHYALEWWAEREPRANLSFAYEAHWPAVSYEPIAVDIFEYHAWADEALANLGYDSIPAYSAALAENHAADWGLVVFVVDSSNDGDGAWPGGYYMFAEECGLALGVTYDANGYGHSRLDMAVAPGIGCAFCALPQFEEAQIPCARKSGILGVETQNSEYGRCLLDEPSIMRHAWQAYPDGLVDRYARGQLGWWDRDCDGVLDPVDEWVDPKGCYVYLPLIKSGSWIGSYRKH